MQTIHGIYKVCWTGANSLYVGGFGIHRMVEFGLGKPLVASFNVGPFTAIFVGSFEM